MIYEDFCALVAAYAEANSLAVHYPGLMFTPPDSGLWLEVVWTHNGGQEVLLSNNDSDVQQGFFRVMVYDRPGQSVVRASSMLENIAVAIPKGTAIGPATIYQAPRRSGPVVNDDRVMQMLTFRYQTT